MKISAFQKVSGINPAFLFPSICSTSLLSHPNRKEGRGPFGSSADFSFKKKKKAFKIYLAPRGLKFWDAGSSTFVAEWELSCYMWYLVLWPGIEPGPPALGAQRLSHWPTREVPVLIFLCFSFLPCCSKSRFHCRDSVLNISHSCTHTYKHRHSLPPIHLHICTSTHLPPALYLICCLP